MSQYPVNDDTNDLDETSPLYEHDETLEQEKEITSTASLVIVGHNYFLNHFFYLAWYLPTRYIAGFFFYLFQSLPVLSHLLHWLLRYLRNLVFRVASRRQEVSPVIDRDLPIEASISFAGGGMTWIYYIGVAHHIYETYDVEKIKILCSSCGCFGGVPLALGLDPYAWCAKDWQTCLVHFSSRSLGPLIDSKEFYAKLWDEYLPADAHQRVSGRLFISMTLFPTFQNVVVSQWNSRQDLVSCIVASMCFPLIYMRSMPTTPYGLAFDGGLTNDQPCVDEHTITVSALNHFANIHPKGLFYPLDVIRVPDFPHVWKTSKIGCDDGKASNHFDHPAWQKARLPKGRAQPASFGCKRL